MTPVPALPPFSQRLERNGANIRLINPRAASARTANGNIIFRRLALGIPEDMLGDLNKENIHAVQTWAVHSNLGQNDSGALSAASARRARAAAAHLAELPGIQESTVADIVFETGAIIGTGDVSSILDAGMTLHGTFGWPIVPASTIKGLVRHWAVDHWLKENPGKQNEALIDDLLGVPTRARPHGVDPVEPDSAQSEGRLGTITFFDAVPAVPEAGGSPAVKVVEDVLTPHYQKYYAAHSLGLEGGPTVFPSGVEPPIPVATLVLKPGARFTVSFVARKRADGESQHDTSIVRDWLEKALYELGIGAKTAAGYGYGRLEAARS